MRVLDAFPDRIRGRIPVLAMALALSGSALPADERPADPPAPEGDAPVADSAPPAGVAPAPGPLEAADRDTLLRIAWRTLEGSLNGRPIQTADLESHAIAGRLLEPRGCWITLRVAGAVRGSMGEIEPTRPLYQQVIFYTRRAATRDARFVPLVETDLPAISLEIAVIGPRQPVGDPATIAVERHGFYLEKWGRRAVFLPGVAAAQGWDGPRTLAALARQASLPEDGWTAGARIETFEAEVIAGGRPEPAPVPAPPPPVAEPPPGEGTAR